jgi:hypothetical protein
MEKRYGKLFRVERFEKKINPSEENKKWKQIKKLITLF